MTKNALLKKGPKNSGMGRPPPPSFGQCPKENVFLLLMSSLTAPLYTYLLNTKNTNSSTKHCNICEWCPMSLFFEGLQWMLRLLFLSVRNVQRSLELLFECVLFLTLTLFWLSNISCRLSPRVFVFVVVFLLVKSCLYIFIAVSQSVARSPTELSHKHKKHFHTAFLLCTNWGEFDPSVGGAEETQDSILLKCAANWKSLWEKNVKVKVLLFDPAKSYVFPKTI